MASIPSTSMPTICTDPALDVIEPYLWTDSERMGSIKNEGVLYPSAASSSSHSGRASDILAPQVDVPMARGSESLNEMAGESSLGQIKDPPVKSDEGTVTASCYVSPEELRHNISEFAYAKSLWDPFCCQNCGVGIAVLALFFFSMSVIIATVFVQRGPVWLINTAIVVMVSSIFWLIFATGMCFFGLRREQNIGIFLKKQAAGERVVESEAIQNPFHSMYNEVVGFFSRGCRTRKSIECDPDDLNVTPERQPETHHGRHLRKKGERESRYRFFNFARRGKIFSFCKGSKSESTPSLEDSRKPEHVE